jgi:hypothetical protein
LSRRPLGRAAQSGTALIRPDRSPMPAARRGSILDVAIVPFRQPKPLTIQKRGERSAMDEVWR